MLQLIELKYYIILCMLFFNNIDSTSSKNEKIDLVELKNHQASSHYFLFNKLYSVNIISTSLDVRGIILYAVSQGDPVTVSLEKSLSSSYSLTGTSVAMIKLLKTNQTNATFYLVTRTAQNCTGALGRKINIVSEQLTSVQPIPGGCNLVHDPDYYPLLDFNILRHTMHFSYEPSNVGYGFDYQEPKCHSSSSSNKRLLYDIYVDSLSQFDTSDTCCHRNNSCTTNSSLKYIKNKLNDVFANHIFSHKLATYSQKDKMEFAVAINPCINVVTYVVVRDPMYNSHSTYAPSIMFKKSFKTRPFLIYEQIFSIVLMLPAFILCFIGHRFFAFELFMFSSSFFFVLCYFAAENLSTILPLSSYNLIIAIGVGVALGSLCVVLWWRFGHASFYCIFISPMGGLLFGSIIFATPLVNLKVFQEPVTNILSLVAIVGIYTVAFVIFPLSKSCVVTSSFFGSYLVIFAISSGVFLCSGISQILPLALYRLTSKELFHAFVILPLSTIDIIMTLSWVALFIVGCGVQFRLQKSRPAFPESSRKNRRSRAYSLQTSSTDSDSLSSRGPSFISENYDGDVDDDLNASCSVDSINFVQQSSDVTPLLGSKLSRKSYGAAEKEVPARPV